MKEAAPTEGQALRSAMKEESPAERQAVRPKPAPRSVPAPQKDKAPMGKAKAMSLLKALLFHGTVVLCLGVFVLALMDTINNMMDFLANTGARIMIMAAAALGITCAVLHIVEKRKK